MDIGEKLDRANDFVDNIVDITLGRYFLVFLMLALGLTVLCFACVGIVGGKMNRAIIYNILSIIIKRR